MSFITSSTTRGLLLAIFFCLPFTVSGAVSYLLTDAELPTTSYILDEEELDGNSLTNQHKLPVAAVVRVSKLFGDPAINTQGRIAYSMSDSEGNLVFFDSDGAFPQKFAYSEEFPITLGLFATFAEIPVLDSIDPVTTLDPDTQYTVLCRLETWDGFKWVGQAGAQNQTAPQRIFHFSNTDASDASWNVIGTLTDLRWNRKHMLEGGSPDSFMVSANGVLARYDNFDFKATTASVDVAWNFDLIESSTGDSVPLEDDGIVSQSVSLSSWVNDSGSQEPDIDDSLFAELELRPLEQLDSTEDYILRCRFATYDGGTESTVIHTTQDLAPSTLLHFNGTLLSVNVIANFNEYVNSPAAGSSGLGYVETSLVIPAGAGSISQAPELEFGSGATVDVRLRNDGSAELINGTYTVRNIDEPADPVTSTVGDYRVEFGSVSLKGLSFGDAGLSAASARLLFPQGLVLMRDAAEAAARSGLPYFDFSASGLPLDSGADLTLDLEDTLPVAARLASEAIPMQYEVSVIKLTQQGALSFTTGSAEYIHSSSLNILEGDAAGGRHDEPDMAERYANDQYYRYVSGFVDPTAIFTVAADGSARLNAEFNIDAGDFRSHFPIGAKIEWTGGASTLELRDGQPMDGSTLNGPANLLLDYHTTCDVPEGDACVTGAAGMETLELEPTEFAMGFSEGGGLFNSGLLVGSPKIEWGARGDGVGGTKPPAHELDSANFGDFFMPGHQLYAEDNGVLDIAWSKSAAADAAPGILLDSGTERFLDPANAGTRFVYGSTEYVNGTGLYAGINLSGVSEEEVGRSRPGDAEIPYRMKGNGISKYYLRMSGVSGRHVAAEGSFGPTRIYNYPFDFSRFQLTFLSSEPEDSWVDGELFVEGAATFSQRFLGLEMDCQGDLTGAELDREDLGAKPMQYWNGMFSPRTLWFAEEDSAPVCSTPNKRLVFGASVEIANIPGQLHGNLGFEPDGVLLTQATSYQGVDSRLGIPAGIRYAGPNDTDYSLVPVGKLYFNDPNQDPNYKVDFPTGGFVTFGATINVPYFRDLQVQAITFASNSDTAPLFLTAGWTEGGKTFFDHADFDPSHKGWPLGEGITFAEYTQPSNAEPDTYLVNAEQDLFGLVPLSYPLRWDSGSAFFESMETLPEDLLVVEIEHQVDYLDAKFADISFGATYDGLPQISITDVLNDEISAASATLSAELTDAVKDGVDGGLEAFDRLLDDSYEAAMDPVFDAIEVKVIQPFYADLAASYEAQLQLNLDIEAGLTAGTPATYQDWITNDVVPLLEVYLYEAGSGSSLLIDELNKLSQTAADANSLIGQVDRAVLDVIKMIDSLVNQVEVVNGEVLFTVDPSGIPDGSELNGLIQKYVPEGGGDLSRNVLNRLVRSLLSELTPPDVANIVGPLIESGTGELNAELNALLEDVDPALDQITETLNRVRGQLVIVHNELNAVSARVATFEALVNNASSELESISQELYDEADSLIRALQTSANAELNAELHLGVDLFVDASIAGDLGDITVEQFSVQLRSRVKDLVLGSELVRQFKFQVRQILYDVEMRVSSGIQSVFAQITEVMTDLVKNTIGDLEEEINPMLGTAGDYLGAGEIKGLARLNGDSLRQLRLDGNFQFEVPDELQVNAYLEINQVTAEDNFTENGCISPGQKAVEVKIGATDIGIDWISPDLRADLIEVRVSMKDFASDGLDFPIPNGAGGSFIVAGGIDFEAFEMSEVRATFGLAIDPEDVSNTECYIGGGATMELSSYEVTGAVFFGRTCTLAPLELVDPDVAELLGAAPFTGAYVYGEVWIPISEVVLGIPASCMFRISAGIGAGAFYFVEGPTFGGKMLAGASGEALCIVSIRGEVKMVGLMNGGSLRYSGTGSLKGKAGACPFCIKFKKSAKITFQDGDWSVDL